MLLDMKLAIPNSSESNLGQNNCAATLFEKAPIILGFSKSCQPVSIYYIIIVDVNE